MLIELRIENLQLVKKASIELHHGLNIVTGETGAGKSMILGALGLLLGQKADGSLVRKGAEHVSVQARIEVPLGGKLHKILCEQNIELGDEQEVVIRRSISAQTNRSKIDINGQMVTLAFLKKMGEWLLDIHSQHEHQSLLNVKEHLNLLDRHLGLEKNLEDYQKHYNNHQSVQKQLQEFEQTLQNIQKDADYLRFQLAEFEGLPETSQEIEALELESQRIQNSARLQELCQKSAYLLDEGDSNVLSMLAENQAILDELGQLDVQFKNLAGLNQLATEQVQELTQKMSGAILEHVSDEQQLDHLQDQLFRVEQLKRKHHCDLEALFALKQEYQQKLERLDHPQFDLDRLNGELEHAHKSMTRAAELLHKKRTQGAKTLQKKLAQQLHDLAMPHAQFEVLVEKTDFRLWGSDHVEFLFSANKGLEAESLAKVASGGELSRVMLAIKTVFCKADDICTQIFDEVDSGLGGETALSVGEKLLELAQNKQVICISHLPQIACKADMHFQVLKTTSGSDTQTSIELLDDQQKIQEIARMLGGEGLTSVAKQHAQELLLQ